MDQSVVYDLLEKQYAGLLALLRRKLRNDQLAADALNNAVLTSLEHVRSGRVNQGAHIAGYVFQVAMNQMRNHQRKIEERADKRVDSEFLHDIASPADEGAPDRSFITAQVHGILQSLPTPRDREIVKRFYLDEDDKADICRDLGLSPLHFDKVIFRARQRMRVLLETKGFKKGDFFSFLLVCFA
ncbi:MAG: RNA polymerase sigma factor [Steroidobacter sp.]